MPTAEFSCSSASSLDVTWAADFFTEEVWTLGGWVTFYVLFFIHLGTRRVLVAGCTPHRNGDWTAQQARNFSMFLGESGLPCRDLIHDRDSVFMPFDPITRADGIEVIRTPPMAPQCNAFAERHVREIRETLDSLILLGESHLRHVLKSIEAFHNHRRPHQGIANVISISFDYPDRAAEVKQVELESGLGGLLNHYRVREAA
ncbi:MAG: transposase family protein [Verrucomicrobia bacterium]|nr:transposase family protein [Verrucomicrobiota bacterium]